MNTGMVVGLSILIPDSFEKEQGRH